MSSASPRRAKCTESCILTRAQGAQREPVTLKLQENEPPCSQRPSPEKHKPRRPCAVSQTSPCTGTQVKKSPRRHCRGAPRLSSQRFRVLFHSLFRVLFIFPSRYLFAIGLCSVFSFRWNLPPTLASSPKEADSWKACRTSACEKVQPHGALTLQGVPFQAT